MSGSVLAAMATVVALMTAPAKIRAIVSAGSDTTGLSGDTMIAMASTPIPRATASPAIASCPTSCQRARRSNRASIRGTTWPSDSGHLAEFRSVDKLRASRRAR